MTALMSACINGNFKVVKLLIENRVDINIKDANGAIALDIAVENKYAEIINILI